MQIQEHCNYILAQNFITRGNVILFLHIVGNYSYNENIEGISLSRYSCKWMNHSDRRCWAVVQCQAVCLPGLRAWVNPAQQNRLSHTVKVCRPRRNHLQMETEMGSRLCYKGSFWLCFICFIFNITLNEATEAKMGWRSSLCWVTAQSLHYS